jgi:hypothetical protein
VAFSLLSWKDKGGLNKRRMLEVVRMNEGSEFLSYFPQWKELYNHLKMRYDELCANIEELLRKGQSLSPKEFTKYASGYPRLENVLWGVHSGSIPSVRAAFSKMNIKTLESLLPKEDINTLGPDPNFGISMEELKEKLTKEASSQKTNVEIKPQKQKEKQKRKQQK